MSLLALSLSGCVNSEPTVAETAYDYTVDVPCRGWTYNDTLFFPISVSENPEIRTPLQRSTNYQLGCALRISSDYQYANVPMLLILQKTDTTNCLGKRPLVIQNLLRQEIVPQVRDNAGRELGNTWGSLIQHETVIDSLSIRFDSVGTYQMLLIPQSGEISSIDGVHSVGLSLRPATNF